MNRRNKIGVLLPIGQQPVAQLPRSYGQFLDGLKERIRKSRLKAAISANKELILLYWHIGHEILLRQKKEGWGAKVIERLSCDLLRAFPDMKGFSLRNLKYMRAFAGAWPDFKRVQQVAAQIPWFHNCILLDKLTNTNEREWYVHKTVEHGWSRNTLILQIESDLFRREGRAVSNFRKTLTPTQSELAQQTTKDPYLFDFLSLSQENDERELEKGLLAHIRKFLIELGAGFAFVGQQVHIEIANEDYYIDLLFYHLKLRCYFVIELKAGKFKPEYAGKMNFYLSAVDIVLRHPDDKPSIGLILCKEKNKITAEYALQDIHKPMGVSEWKTRIIESLPKRLKGKLPSVDELEKKLRK